MVGPGKLPDEACNATRAVARHPPAEQLCGHAAGTLCCGLSLLVACHLTFCPECRAAVARIEAICGGLLACAPEDPPGPGALASLWGRIGGRSDAPPAEATPTRRRRHGWRQPEILPAPLRDRIARAGGKWRPGLPGFSEYRLAGFEGAQVSLLRARAALQLPAHTHSGNEATLVLSGRLRDGDRVYGRGDVALADETCDHRPQIAEGATCVCLIVLAGRLRFTGRFARALNLFNG